MLIGRDELFTPLKKNQGLTEILHCKKSYGNEVYRKYLFLADLFFCIEACF